MKNDLIIKYIMETYSPEAIIVYGSYADGSANENSDFDALVITDSVKKHDSSEVDNTILDVWVYPTKYFSEEYDPDEFIQIFDGNIVLDRKGNAEKLKRRIGEYINQLPLKTDEEIRQEIDWCYKMFLRTKRCDAEGFYRWHWLLFDSLEIYFDVKRLHCFGPKKALRYMEKEDLEAFRIYSAALSELNTDCLEDWISYLKRYC
ncbi:nucleotidyltransferase domain-containing protein [Butyrivibrio fibrisolvens]|uniref:nucleotidyltransferase domain-containing protein n=1 Tax=Butyrivibrio fibrisolvens TaxID=831 RepID=UPI00047F3A5C|nr:nucleotidyltransferase domain-containing protein [Butyrivibrio fibrisolvens]